MDKTKAFIDPFAYRYTFNDITIMSISMTGHMKAAVEIPTGKRYSRLPLELKALLMALDYAKK